MCAEVEAHLCIQAQSYKAYRLLFPEEKFRPAPEINPLSLSPLFFKTGE